MSSPRTIRVDLAGRAYDIAIGPGLIDRAGRHFFELGRRAGLRTQPVIPKGPPPAAFRDAASGLVHVVGERPQQRLRLEQAGPGLSGGRFPVAAPREIPGMDAQAGGDGVQHRVERSAREVVRTVEPA